MNKIKIYKYGITVFNNETVKFKRWLVKVNISLGGAKPIDLINTNDENNMKMVYNCLNRIDYGIYG